MYDSMLRDSESSPVARLNGVLDELDLAADRLATLNGAIMAKADEAASEGVGPPDDRLVVGSADICREVLRRLNEATDELENVVTEGDSDQFRESLEESFGEGDKPA